MIGLFSFKINGQEWYWWFVGIINYVLKINIFNLMTILTYKLVEKKDEW